MEFKKILEQNPHLTLDSFQDLQKEYDKEFVDDSFEGFDKVRHTYSHMGKLFGRLAEYIQMIEDRNENFHSKEIEQKVIPDLLVYAAWLAREFNVNIEQAYKKRLIQNIEKLHTDKISSEDLKALKEMLESPHSK